MYKKYIALQKVTRVYSLAQLLAIQNIYTGSYFVVKYILKSEIWRAAVESVSSSPAEEKLQTVAVNPSVGQQRTVSRQRWPDL